AAGRRRSTPAARGPARAARAGIVSERLGVLVLGAARESYFVSRRRVLPLAASTAVVGVRAGDGSGSDGPHRGRDRGRADVAGARDLRDGAAHGRRYLAGPARGSGSRRRSL